MQCEGGEIYPVAGHLGLMGMPDPLLQALGLPIPPRKRPKPMPADGDVCVGRLADPMRMMKLFAVAYQTGSKDEVVNYINGFEGFLKNVGGSVPALVSISTELDAALDVAGHVLPIATLASGSAAAATVDVPETTSLPAPVETAPPAAAPPEPVVASDLEPATVPLPTKPSPEPAPAPATPSTVALPASTVALPEVAPVPEEEVSINIESEKQVAKATQDAFLGV